MLNELRYFTRSSPVATKLSRMLHERLHDFLQRYPHFKMTKPRYFWVRFDEGIGGPQDVNVFWEGKDIVLSISFSYAVHLHHSRVDQLFTMVVWLMKAGPEAEQITVNLSDGEAPSFARFTPSSCFDFAIPMPDQYFFASHGFIAMRQHSYETDIPWHDRSDELIWRGTPVGTGMINPAPCHAENPAIVQRIRLAHLAKSVGIDFKFVPTSVTNDVWPLIERAGLSGERVEEGSWATRKYALDVDGFTNTWSNFLIRLHLGCCVFKVDSQFGYRQWYYHHLTPFEHYIPVKADLSDISDQIEWARSNPKKAEEIAANGQNFARQLTFESESVLAGKLILENWRWPL